MLKIINIKTSDLKITCFYRCNKNYFKEDKSVCVTSFNKPMLILLDFSMSSTILSFSSNTTAYTKNSSHIVTFSLFFF